MGIAVALLQLLQEVGKGVESVDRREGVGRGGSITTPKVGSRDRGLVAERSSLESPADVNHALCEAKSGASYGSSPNNRLNRGVSMERYIRSI